YSNVVALIIPLLKKQFRGFFKICYNIAIDSLNKAQKAMVNQGGKQEVEADKSQLPPLAPQPNQSSIENPPSYNSEQMEGNLRSL
ncbi:MAG: hypothetical protein AAFW67_09845, partial [Cyanobacteria bacterium J06638_38]